MKRIVFEVREGSLIQQELEVALSVGRGDAQGGVAPAAGSPLSVKGAVQAVIDRVLRVLESHGLMIPDDEVANSIVAVTMAILNGDDELRLPAVPAGPVIEDAPEEEEEGVDRPEETPAGTALEPREEPE